MKSAIGLDTIHFHISPKDLFTEKNKVHAF